MSLCHDKKSLLSLVHSPNDVLSMAIILLGNVETNCFLFEQKTDDGNTHYTLQFTLYTQHTCLWTYSHTEDKVTNRFPFNAHVKLSFAYTSQSISRNEEISHRIPMCTSRIHRTSTLMSIVLRSYFRDGKLTVSATRNR